MTVMTSAPPETSARVLPFPSTEAREGVSFTPEQARARYDRGELPYPLVSRPVPQQEKDFVVALYLSGLSIGRISDHIQRTVKAVRNWITAAGIDTATVGYERTKKIRTGDRDRRVYEMRVVQGWKWVAICNAVGVPVWNRTSLQEAMRRYAKRNGLPMSRKS